MTANLMNMVYTYIRFRIKNPPDIVFALAYFGRIITWTPSRLALDMALRGRYQYINRLVPITELTRTENQLGTTAFDKAILFELWDSDLTNSINPYFELYI